MKNDPADAIRHWINVRHDAAPIPLDDDWGIHYPDFEMVADAIIAVLDRHQPTRDNVVNGLMLCAECSSRSVWCEIVYPCPTVGVIAMRLGIEP